MADKVLFKFAAFRDSVKRLHPPVYYADIVEERKAFGRALKKLLNGGSKFGYLIRGLLLERRIQARKRFFYVATLDQLELCLGWYTDDPRYAREMRKHELGHTQVFRSFIPSNHGDPRPDVIYSLLITSDNVVVPSTHPCLRIGSLSALTSVKLMPYLLILRWHVETLREFWRYVRDNTTDRALTDEIVLGS